RPWIRILSNGCPLVCIIKVELREGTIKERRGEFPVYPKPVILIPVFEEKAMDCAEKSFISP
ncbi:MAG TPA: hypothetical protein PKV38_19985, partial [bacterium]|nr:hypothetical protein [bacterium]